MGKNKLLVDFKMVRGRLVRQQLPRRLRSTISCLLYICFLFAGITIWVAIVAMLSWAIFERWVQF